MLVKKVSKPNERKVKKGLEVVDTVPDEIDDTVCVTQNFVEVDKGKGKVSKE